MMHLVNTLDKRLQKLFERPVLFFSIIYFLSFSTLLINNGVFWDDWHVHFLSDRQAFDLYNAISRPFHGLLFVGLRLLTPSHYLITFLTFILSWITGVFFYFIIKRLGAFSKEQAFWIAALYLIFPQFYSRICETILFFTIYLSVFTVTSYFYIFSSPSRPSYKKLYLLLPFFFSFGLESAMLFILVPLALRYYFLNNSKFPIRWNTILDFVRREWAFLLLPFLYYLMMKYIVVLAPNKIPTNVFSLQHLWEVPRFILNSWEEGFNRAVLPLFHYFKFLVLILVISSIVISPTFDSVRIKRNLVGTGFAMIGFVFSILPYVLVGKDIGYYYIMDRNSVLALFSFAFFMYYSVSLCFSLTKLVFPKRLLLLLILGLFIHRNFIVYRSFLIASIKQDSVMYYMRTIPDFQEGTTFLIKDNTFEYLAKETPLESSVARGLMRTVFGTTTRCIAHIPLECLNASDGENISVLHNIHDYSRTKDQYQVLIDYGPISIRENSVFRWTFYKIFQAEHYRDNLKNFIDMRLEKL